MADGRRAVNTKISHLVFKFKVEDLTIIKDCNARIDVFLLQFFLDVAPKRRRKVLQWEQKCATCRNELAKDFMTTTK